jgi:hypothetical protein
VASAEAAERAGAAVMQAFDEVRQGVRVQEQQRLVAQLLRADLPRQLLQMEEVLRDEPPTGELLRFAGVPTAALQYLREHLELVPHLEVGLERDVPAKSLENYEWLTPPPQGRSIVKLRVLRPGWKHRGELLMPPEVVCVDRSEP